ncbi:hypothetical protein NP493_1548g00010 [Ridgeia piscesae]|uniref:Uncharacterized protein n=1 Tax=Ridgeia piscesae TaxID=27915 RepID=A0AAD9JYV6_RIDPI|nr:hypothetical protein NP493_1548g00010 [Ridgeia piscesae]
MEREMRDRRRWQGEVTLIQQHIDEARARLHRLREAESESHSLHRLRSATTRDVSVSLHLCISLSVRHSLSHEHPSTPRLCSKCVRAM